MIVFFTLLPIHINMLTYFFWSNSLDIDVKPMLKYFESVRSSHLVYIAM